MTTFVVFNDNNTTITNNPALVFVAKIDQFSVYSHAPADTDNDISAAIAAYQATSSSKMYVTLDIEANKFAFPVSRISQANSGIENVLKTQSVAVSSGGSTAMASFAVSEISETEVNKVFPYTQFKAAVQNLQDLFSILG